MDQKDVQVLLLGTEVLALTGELDPGRTALQPRQEAEKDAEDRA